VLVDNAVIAGLSVKEAAALSLPALARAVAYVSTKGVITRSDFGAIVEWRRPTGQPIVGVVRIGPFLQIGGTLHRLPDALFSIAEAVDALNAAGSNDGARFAALAELRETLPLAEVSGAAQASGLLSSMTICVADAFSLDLDGEDENARLVPILHHSKGELDELLLPEAAQKEFGSKHFNAFGSARPVYAMGGGLYVVLSGPVRRALDVVRRTQTKPLATKRALMASPQAFLRETLGDDVDDAVIENVLRETSAYSKRVLGLGLWQKRILPWVQVSGQDWFNAAGSSSPSNEGSQQNDDNPIGGVVFGDKRVSLEVNEAENLRHEVERAIGAGEPTVVIQVSDQKIVVPASHDTLKALLELEIARTRLQAIKASKGSDEPSIDRAPHVLVIRPNEDEIEVEGTFVPRRVSSSRHPVCLTTVLKPHQEEGLAWLLDTYRAGRPGVLLADDMGLGKTLQGLSFLAWLRDGMAAAKIPRAPVAVVAPTGLLQNWKAEEARHLAHPGLGRCLEAFGSGLAELKIPGPDGRPSLKIEALRDADWVLTTYETLRDYDRDFGAVHFAAMLFDEAQKIKTPGTRITDAAKAMNVDFRVALTGTPVENRLSDLWCISDAVHPAFLGDLKTFSSDYERSPDTERLKRLKATLDTSYGGAPPFLLRRLKSDRLPDLPLPQEIAAEAPMPILQRQAYETALGEARAARGQPGAILGALQRLRSISLHPDPELDGPDDVFIDASARCRITFAALDKIAAAGERALIFVDDLSFQAKLAGIIQRRYGLKAAPAIINGSVSGQSRQKRVDRFQDSADAGFDAMILSPRAGGVGLTLTAANHAIHLSRWWNPAVEDQCTGRVLRIGQTRPVYVHLPIAILDAEQSSFDQNLDALIRRKRRLFQDAFMPPEATQDERDDLFERTVA
jgi:hypothetical protein